MPLLWLSRLFGAFLILYGLFVAYQTWSWTHLGLHQRVYDGESQAEIEIGVIRYALFYEPAMRYAGLFVLAGFVIIALSFSKSTRTGRK